jgi:hypothetical protein
MLMVEAEQDKVIDPGPPISFQGWCRQMDPPDQETVTLGFTAHGRYGEVYWPGAFLGGKRPPAPMFKLTAEDGKVLFTAPFNVEKSGQCKYAWRIPKGWKGKYRIEISASFGPFEYKLSGKDTLFTVK